MPATSLIDALIAEAPVLTDGAWGTELQARGLPAGEIGDLWNLSHPERVEEVAHAYVDAGSRVILTNTFRANRIALEPYHEESRVEEINRAGVEISRRAADGRALVFASIGPSGKMLITGDVDEAQLAAAFTEQSQALATAGADGLVVESMTDLAEARIAVQAAAATGLPVVGCMVFDAGKRRDRTIMGIAPQTAAVELVQAGAQVIGANCGIGVEAYIPICAALASATDRPIWIKPNAGLPEFVDGKFVYRMTVQRFAGHVPALIAAGARFIGGCCGTTPEFVAALRRQLSPARQSPSGGRGN
jgi:5-methyltetrahydrofolate--homocysteine methyltransferase